ncbi:NAD(P)/FAD-dependent oxidoreductase [Deinococcus sp.]|uniref:NAD(P)/FAD-dependent oxidoreductase n=1 Tax=Deinococcus sp. TaxID=47478 RepID=UPI003CC6C0F3
MTTQATQDVLIVGAGLAGLALGRELARAGRRVTLLDKSRGVSGRSSTRRLAADRLELPLDHGARFFTARHPQTLAFVQEGLAAGWLREWTRSIPRWQGGTVVEEGGGHPRYAPPAGMNTLGRELGRGLKVELEAQVVRLSQVAGGWRAECGDGRSVEAAAAVLNLPAPQIVPLLEGAALDLSPFQAVAFDPCWAVGALLHADVAGADWPALRMQDHPALEWIAREHTKRSPTAPHTPALMLHARPDWTRQHLQDDKAQVAAALLEHARDVVGPLELRASFAHRWLYATPTVRYPHSHGWLPDSSLGWCGDWCTPDPHGPRVEAALLSGWALAEALTVRS